MVIRQKRRKITFILLGIIGIIMFLYISMFNALKYSLKIGLGDRISDSTISHIVVLVCILSIVGILLGILFFSLFSYFFSKLFDCPLSKTDSLYICSLVMLISTLMNIPLGIMNLLNTDHTTIVLNPNLYFIILNPFVVLASYIYYRYLSRTGMKRNVAIGFGLTFFIIQTGFAFLSSVLSRIGFFH